MKLALKLLKALLVIFMLGILVSSVYITPAQAIAEPIQIVKDIWPGSNSSNPSNIVKFKSYSFFVADDGVNGFNPWITDGSPSGTHKIKNISSPAQKLDISQYWQVSATNNAVFFTIGPKPNDPGTSNYQLWKTDGTEAGTIPVGNIPQMLQGSIIPGLQARGNDLFIFQGHGPAGLYIYSGGSLRVLKIWDDRPANPLIYFGGMAVLNNNVYFIIDRGSNQTNELWRSDGTVNGTIKVASLPETSSAVPIGPLVAANNLIFLRADGHIYQSTGAIGNLEQIDGNYTMSPYKGAFVSDGNAVYFVSNRDFITNQTDLYITTGKEAGVQKLVENVYEYLVPINGRLYFYSYNSSTRGYIGRSDGTQAGTGIFYPSSGAYSALFYDVVEVGDTTYFLGRNAEGATEIWASDSAQGAQLGCQPVASLYPGARADNSTRAWLTRNGSHLLFVGDDGQSGFELMKFKVLLNDIFIPVVVR